MSPGKNSIWATDPSRSVGRRTDSCGPESEALHVIDVKLDDPRLAPFVDAHPFGSVYHHPAWLQTLRAEYARGIVILGCEIGMLVCWECFH